MARRLVLIALIAWMGAAAGCARRQPPAAGPTAAPPTAPAPAPATAPPDRPSERVEEALPVPSEALAADDIAGRTLDELNRDSPFKPVFFALDRAELDDMGRVVVTANAALLKRYPTWVVTIEGHCDERGTAEYNLALGERRAAAVRTYLLSLGVAPDRIRIVSYGKEFPFDPGHTEDAWARNRRAHFVITSK